MNTVTTNNQSPVRAMMQSLPAASNHDYASSRTSGAKRRHLNPLLVSLTVNSVGSGQQSPREEQGKGLSDYLSNLPQINHQKDNISRRNDVLSKSMAISSQRSDVQSSTFQVTG